MCTDMKDEQKTTIAVSKPVHKQLAYQKLDCGYSSFEDLFVNEILNESE